MIGYSLSCFVNVGNSKDCTIKALALIIREQIGYSGKLVFDDTKPDGTPQKLWMFLNLKILEPLAETIHLQANIPYVVVEAT